MLKILTSPQKTYPRFCACPYCANMKVDLIEINKLSPPGLWDLGVLASVIAMLRGVMASGHGSAFLCARMMLHFSESLRERTRDNLNMRIKAWVMLCPNRIAHVRNIIGEAAIRRWRTNRLADYALTRYFGDWQRKWPNGFSAGRSDREPKRPCTPKYAGNIRAYNWKLFALVKIVNVQAFLYRKPKPDQQSRQIQDAYYKLWGVELGDSEPVRKTTQPRGARSFKPIRFTPDELETEAETETAPPIIITQDATKRIEREVENGSGAETGDPPFDWQPP